MQAKFRRGGRRLPGVIRLHAAGGHERVAPLRKRIGHEEFSLRTCFRPGPGPSDRRA